MTLLVLQIFETFGPVVAPLYSIRFNKVEDIADKNITVGAKVFYGTNYRDFTQYVFVESIRNQKGSDASWENNNEPPPHVSEHFCVYIRTTYRRYFVCAFL